MPSGKAEGFVIQLVSTTNHRLKSYLGLHIYGNFVDVWDILFQLSLHEAIKKARLS